MDSKNKSGAIKPKRSKRRLLTKSDNYIRSNDTNKTIDKLTLKTRGPYVVRNPTKLVTNDLLDDQPKPRNRESQKNTSQDTSQRKFSSTVITTSVRCNRKFITHEIVKTKKKNKSNKNIGQEAVTKPSVISNNKKNSSKNFKAKSQSSYKKKNKEDDVIYVLPSRNNYQSVTNTNSVVSKQIDNSSSYLYNDKGMLNETGSGVDRIADEVLEGWIKRKEKRLKGSEHSNIIAKERADEILFNLSVDLVENTLKTSNHEIQQESSTISKHTDKLQRKTQQSVSRKTILESIDDTIVVEQENDESKQFYIIENDESEKATYPLQKPRYRKPRILVQRNLNTQSLIYPRIRKPYRNTTQSHKEIKRNGKKEFLNLIKRELEIPNKSYKEPRNMFEALKTIARNKTKNRISFNDGITSKTRWPNNADCEYDNPKLIRTFKRYGFEPKSRQLSYKRLKPGKKIIKNKITSIEVKHFHRTPDKRLQVITI